jgi:uncharacterized protein YndB with AHSA1/START domain
MIDIDIPSQLAAIYREVGERPLETGDAVGVLLRRSYGAPIDDVWDAVTDPDRMKRWFLPVTGDLRVGGNFQLEGNAGGEILSCEPPRLLRVTFGGPTSVVELRLAPDGDSETVLELEHTVPLEIAQSAAGALYVGPGWDGALMGLDLFLRGEAPADPAAAANSLEVQRFSKQSLHAWTAVVESSGTASSDEIVAATEVSLAQFAPDVDD